MTQYSYKAVSDTGETLTGQMEAASVEEVIGRLQDQGHTPLEARPAEGVASGRGLAALFNRGPFSGDQLAQFTHQLATLLGAGQPLDRALTILLELPEGESAKKLIERVRDRVRGGTALSSALDEEHGVFPRLYVSLVRAGEAGGSLEGTLRRLADYLERAQALRGSIVNALIYPAFLLVGVLGSLVLLLAYVVPQFVPIFQDMQVPIPWITAVVLALGKVLQAWWWLIALLLIGGILLWRARLREPSARLAWHTRLLGLRVVGPLLLKVETARIARTLGTLLKNGVPLLSSLTIARQVTGNLALDAALSAAHEQVKGGAGLSLALGAVETVSAAGVADGAGRRGSRSARRHVAEGGGHVRAGVAPLDRSPAGRPRAHADHRDDRAGGHHHGRDPAAPADADQQYSVSYRSEGDDLFC